MKKLLPIIIVALIVGGGAFYGGMKYQESTRQNFIRQNLGGQQMADSGAGLRIGNRGGGGFVNGEIISKDANSITVKLPDGGSKIVFYSDTTQIGEFTAGTSKDLEIGKTASVNGATNSDGSITAQSIQMRSQ